MASSITPYPGRFTKSTDSVLFPSGSSISMIVVNSSGSSVTATGVEVVDSVSFTVVEEDAATDVAAEEEDEDDEGRDEAAVVFGAAVVMTPEYPVATHERKAGRNHSSISPVDFLWFLQTITHPRKKWSKFSCLLRKKS